MFSHNLISANLACCSNQPSSDEVPGRKDPIVIMNSAAAGVKVGIGAMKIAPRKPETKGPWNRPSYGCEIRSILRALKTKPDIDQALGPWERRLGNKERTIILKEQVDWERAVEIFEWFKRKGCHELNVIHYNVMLRILGRSWEWRMVEKLWLEMQEKGINPKNSTYGTLIDVFSKGGRANEALVWLGDMIKRGLEPDEITGGAIIQTCKKAHELHKVHGFLRRWSPVRAEDASMCYNTQTFNTLIDAYGKGGHLKEACEAFAKMIQLGVAYNMITFNIMIHICGTHGMWEEAADLMEQMEEHGYLPDKRTHNVILSLFVKDSNLEMASWYFSEIKRVGMEADIVAYRMLLFAYASRSMLTEAESLIHEMEKMGFEMDEYTQSALVRMYIGVGRPGQAWSWFEMLQDTMSSNCYAANIDAFGERGHFSHAKEAFHRCISRQKLSVLVFNVMIKAYGIAKDYEKVCDTIDGMEKFGISPDKCTFYSVISILSAAELPGKAIRYVRKMQLAGFVDTCFPYCTVISSFSRLRELGMAEAVFQEMLQFGIKPDIVLFGVLINAFAEASDVHGAEKYLSLMKNAGFDANFVINNTLVKIYTRVGCLPKAEEAYKKARVLNDGPMVYSSTCMIELYAENYMVNEAESVFMYLKQRGEADEFSYAMMTCLYKKLGLFEESFALACEMVSRKLVCNALSYSVVIELFASNGRLTDAVEIFQQMLNSGLEPNDATFRSLGNTLIEKGLSRDAVNHLELARKTNCKTGLKVWLQALQSVLSCDDPTCKYELK